MHNSMPSPSKKMDRVLVLVVRWSSRPRFLARTGVPGSPGHVHHLFPQSYCRCAHVDSLGCCGSSEIEWCGPPVELQCCSLAGIYYRLLLLDLKRTATAYIKQQSSVEPWTENGTDRRNTLRRQPVVSGTSIPQPKEAVDLVDLDPDVRWRGWICVKPGDATRRASAPLGSIQPEPPWQRQRRVEIGQEGAAATAIPIMPAQAQAQAQQTGFCQMLNRPARIRRGAQNQNHASVQPGRRGEAGVCTCGHLLPLLSLCAFVGEDVPTTPPGPGREGMYGWLLTLSAAYAALVSTQIRMHVISAGQGYRQICCCLLCINVIQGERYVGCVGGMKDTRRNTSFQPWH